MPTIRLTVSVFAGACLLLLPGDLHGQKRQRDRITREEIMSSAHKDLDLYQVIRSLRPQFLSAPSGVRSLGGSNTPMIAVYVDGRRETGLDALKAIVPVDVEEVRYLDATRAGTEFGPSASSGAVIVKMCKGAGSVVQQSDSTKKPTGC